MAKDIRSLSRYNESTEQTEIFYPATTTDAIADVDREQSLTETLEDTAFVGEVVGDPTGEWNKGEAEDYIDKEIAKVKNWVSNTPVTNVVTVSSLPASGNVNTLYRVAGTNTYSEYGWDGTQFVKLDEKEYGIDAEPTAGSNNLVKSGGVAEELALGAVYDVSAKNPTAGTNNDGKWESLSALLSNANLNTLIPTSVRKGGMSVKFVLTSSNKYVKYNYLLSSTTNTNIANVENWQGVDEEPTAGSNNLVKSGGVWDINTKIGTVSLQLGNITSNSPYYNKICNINIPANTPFKIRVKAESGTIGRFLLIANDYHDGTHRLQDYCALDTWYTISADYDIFSLGWSSGNNPSAYDVEFECILSTSLEEKIENVNSLLEEEIENESKLQKEYTDELRNDVFIQKVDIGNISGAIVKARLIKRVNISAGTSFRFRYTGSGTVDRLVLECNGSLSNLLQDYCQLGVWYEITAPINITEFDYQTGSGGATNLTNVVFELDMNTLESKVNSNTSNISEISTEIDEQSQQIVSLENKYVQIRNLFNPTNCDYNSAWGTPRNDYSTTGYINVKDKVGYTLYFSYNNGVACACRQMKLYDSNKNDITQSVSGSSYIDNIFSYVIQNQSIAYIRCAIHSMYLDENNATKKFQIECNEGIGIHPYMAYGVVIEYLKNEYLDADYIRDVAAGEDANTAQVVSKLYLTDKRTDLFFSPMYKNWQHINNRFCRVSVTGATIYRQFMDLVTIDAASNGSINVKTYDDKFEVLASDNIETIVTPQSQNGNIRCLFMGSSISGHGTYQNRLKTMCGEGFESIGTRHASPNDDCYFEAVGGWGFFRYAKYSTTKATPTSPFWHPANGRYWGVVGFWKDVMTYNEFDSSNPNSYVMNGRKTTATAAGFGQDGYISGSRLQVGDIMYDDANSHFVQWNGSSWVQIDTPTNWGFDFVKYGNMWNITAPDLFVMAELSTNDFRDASTTPNFTTWNNDAEAMFTALKTWKNDIHIAMLIPISTFGGDYSYGEFVQKCNYRMYQSRINQIENFDNREDENIYLIDDAIFFDEMYGYPLSSDSSLIKPNQEYTGNEVLRVQTGSPHPTTQGEYLLADGMYGIIQYIRGLINS